MMQGVGIESHYEQQMQEQYGGSLWGEAALAGGFLGTEIAQNWTTKTLLGSKRLEQLKGKHGRLGAMLQARKEAYAQSGQISKAFWGTKGGPWSKWKAAHGTARSQIAHQVLSGKGKAAVEQSLLTTARRANRAGAKVVGSQATKTGAAMLGKLTAGSKMRAAAGLLRAPLGVANAYMWLGSMVPMIAEGAIAGVSAAMREGARIRNSTPETSVGWQDMATRERAFTMRQASSMAIHMSQSGARAALGNEADYLH
jgi:hypothetical protein